MATNAVRLDFRHAKSLRVLDFLQQNLGPLILFAKLCYRPTNIALDTIVARITQID